jgi:hypothetical protein
MPSILQNNSNFNLVATGILPDIIAAAVICAGPSYSQINPAMSNSFLVPINK